MRRTLLLGAATLAAVLPTTARPAVMAGPTLSVGEITSTKSCALYREYAGRAGAIVTPYGAAAFASWRSWLVKDCIDNFASLKTSLQAALAASGGVSTRVGGGRYVVSGRISEVSGGGDRATPVAPDASDYAIASNSMTVNMDVVVRDGAGRIVFGGLLTKSIEVGSNIKIDGFESSSNASGQAAYTRLQHEVALAVARLVAFHFTPLRVTPTGGRIVRLNYGTPLLTNGTLLQAIGSDGQPMRLRVMAAATGVASAEVEGDGDPARLAPETAATVLEADSAASGARRFERVDLP